MKDVSGNSDININVQNIKCHICSLGREAVDLCLEGPWGARIGHQIRKLSVCLKHHLENDHYSLVAEKSSPTVP